MGDTEEAQMQISPETPGRFTALNPFESPSDYCTLQEQIVSSPSAFKSKKSSPTPGKFSWSIDRFAQLALINPVEIGSEDIRRQAMYLSHARIDTENEERRQKAIEEFFAKSLIVPSPWTEHEGKQVSQFKSTKSIDLNSCLPIGEMLTLPGKSNAACQTVLSLPVDFNLEKILGEYFRTDEFADRSQENPSSSSLRRKLFLEENGNTSECLSPSLHNPCSSQPLCVFCLIDISPVRCRSPLETSSSVSSQMGDGWEVTSLAQTLYSRLYQFYFLTNARQSYFCSKLYRRVGIRPMFLNYIFRTIYMNNSFERMQLIFNYKKIYMMLCCYSL